MYVNSVFRLCGVWMLTLTPNLCMYVNGVLRVGVCRCGCGCACGWMDVCVCVRHRRQRTLETRRIESQIPSRGVIDRILCHILTCMYECMHIAYHVCVRVVYVCVLCVGGGRGVCVCVYVIAASALSKLVASNLAYPHEELSLRHRIYR